VVERRPEAKRFLVREEIYAQGSEALRFKFRLGGASFSQIPRKHPAPLDPKREEFAQNSGAGNRARLQYA
jgi:hypothetical protein